MIDYDLDLLLLKVFLNKKNYEKYESYVSKSSLSEEAKLILKNIKIFYEIKALEDIDLKVFVPWFLEKEGLSKEDSIYYKHILSKLKKTEVENIDLILEGLKKRKLWSLMEKIHDSSFNTIKLEELIHKFNEGLFNNDEELEYFGGDIDRAANSLKQEGNLSWRLNGLNNIVGKIGKGVFTLIAAYQNKGKTALAVSEASYMAKQLKGNKKVLYFNNEEHEARLVYRFYQSVIGTPINKILKYKEKAKTKYSQILNGDLDRIMIFNVYKSNINQIETLCSKHNPGLIIIDQLDNILSPKQLESSRPYKELYEWARNLSKKYAPVIGLSQASGDTIRKDRDTNKIVHQEWLGEQQLHWSRVDKQGAADVFITVGCDNVVPDIRNIEVHRCKLNGNSGRFCAKLKANIMRVEDD